MPLLTIVSQEEITHPWPYLDKHKRKFKLTPSQYNSLVHKIIYEQYNYILDLNQPIPDVKHTDLEEGDYTALAALVQSDLTNPTILILKEEKSKKPIIVKALMDWDDSTVRITSWVNSGIAFTKNDS